MFSGCAIRVTGHDTVAHQNFTVIGVSATLTDTLYTLATANLAANVATDDSTAVTACTALVTGVIMGMCAVVVTTAGGITTMRVAVTIISTAITVHFTTNGIAHYTTDDVGWDSKIAKNRLIELREIIEYFKQKTKGQEFAKWNSENRTLD
jgi:hypothetical protein